MTHDIEDDAPDDPVLNRWIREAQPEDEDADLPPEVLYDYVRGRLTNAEEDGVRSRLAVSARLREDARFLASLGDPDLQARCDATPVPPLPVPSRAPFLRLLAVAAGVALLIVAALLVLRPPAGDGPEWLLAQALTRDQVRVDPPRGDGPDRPAAPDAAAAALLAFQEAVRYDGHAFRVITPGGAAGPRRIRVVLRDAAPDFTARIPDAAENPTAWFLSIPSLERRRLPLGQDDVAMAWPDPATDRGVLTVSYTVAGVHDAAPALEVLRSGR